MKHSGMALLALLLSPIAFATSGSTTDSGSSKNCGVTVTPEAAAVIDQDWWYPLRLESADALSRARFYYRRDNERAAADEIRKAASWMDFAADHALQHTQQALTSARTDLLTIADDLDTGKVTGAARLDNALSHASSALAEWHYYRARQEYGQNDADNAARDLEAAAANLENAAVSAHLQYGPDTVTVFDEVNRDGKMVSEGKTIDNDMLGKHLDGIKGALETMADSMK